jgi:hypothetical protein
MNSLVVPYDPQVGNPNVVPSEPQKLGQPEHNRALETSLKGDTDKDYSIGIKDIDEAVAYYFNNVLKLSVVQNNTRINVPIIYGNQEHWKTIQQDGYLRDKTGKIMAPLIMFKRTVLNQNRALGFKLDGNKANNLQYFETSYNRRNIYSNFAALNSRNPEKRYGISVTPDYVTVEYSCIIWTYFIEQMDKLLEAINFASRSYWGDPNKFLFYSSIDSFQESVNYDQGEDRAIRNEFTMTLNGYLIPDSINKTMAMAASRVYGVSNVVFGLETATSAEQFVANKNKPTATKLASVAANDSTNVIGGSGGGTGLTTEITAYLMNNQEIAGAYTSYTQATFPKSWATAPSGFPANNINNFTFFVNSAFIDQGAIVSFVDNLNDTSTLTVNTTVLGFGFDVTDTIYAIGKFK